MQKNWIIRRENLFKKLFVFLFFMVFAISAQAVSIELDGSRTIVSGTDCESGTVYRFGTSTTYEGTALDILVEVEDADNDYSEGDCVYVKDNTLATRLRDTDDGDNEAHESYKITLVQQGTTTPVEVDRLMVTAFDLDTNTNKDIETDDVYIDAPDGTYISDNSLVNYAEGSYYNSYNVKMIGWDGGNCDDTQATPDPTCRASSIWVNGSAPNKVSQIRVRVQNDNAYGDRPTDSENIGLNRLIQLSFQIEDFSALFNGQKEYGDAPSSYGTAGNRLDGTVILGNGLPADTESSYQASNDALGDDTRNENDEDGVKVGSDSLSKKSFATGDTVTLTITTYGSGYLNGWFDWNRDGDFDDAGEHIITDKVISNNGESSSNASSGVTLTTEDIVVPSNAKNGRVYARFRFSETDNLAAGTDSDTKGEVEDYAVTITGAGTISGKVTTPNGKGIQGVTISLTDASGTVLKDIDNNDITTQTDANGAYSFSDVVSDTIYIVSGTLSGYTSVSDTDGANDDKIEVTVAPDTAYTDNNFVDTLPVGTISGSVTDHHNQPLANATLTLYLSDGTTRADDNNGTQVPQLTTDGTGNFNFTNITIGDYIIKESNPAGYISINDDAGDEEAQNSNKRDDLILVQTTASNPNDNDNSFTDRLASGSVSGSVTKPDSTPLANVTLTITDNSGTVIQDINGTDLTTQTDTDGNYLFTNIPMGSYIIHESDLPDYTSVSDTDGANDNKIAFILTNEGESLTGNNFVDGIAGISGMVEDSHGNPLAGAVIRLVNADYSRAHHISGAIVADINTTANGQFLFENLNDGDYFLLELDPAGYFSINDTAGDDEEASNVDNDNKINVHLNPGEIDSDNVFTDQSLTHISGFVYADTTGDGNGNTPLSNVTITLNSCQNGSYHATVTTQNNGSYCFTELPSGCYIITETDKSGYISLHDSDSVNDNNITVTLQESAIENQNFIDQPSLFISGTVRADMNFDNIPDQGVPNVTVTLINNSTQNIVQTTKTTQHGTYIFSAVAPGTYLIKESDPVGFVSLSDSDGANDNTITVTLVQTDIQNQNFLDQKRVTVSGTIKVDTDGDKVVDTVLPNVKLNLLDENGNILQTTTTDANGDYSFSGLEPGKHYTIEIVEKTGYEPLGDADGGNDHKISIDIPLSGFGDITGQDFEELATAPQYILLTKNAEKKEGHIGSFIPYTILVENIDQSYTYANLTVEDRLPAGFIYEKGSARIQYGNITKELTATGAKEITFGPFTLHPGESATITYLLKVGVGVAGGKHTNSAIAVQNGQSVSNTTTADVIITSDTFVDNATLIGKVFEDKNGNGIQDKGEKGIPGVRLATVTGMVIETDAYGRYHLADLESGGFGGRGRNFILKVDPATLPEGARFTTENPRVYRITAGQLNKIDFGIKLPKQERYARDVEETKIKTVKVYQPITRKTTLGSIYFDSDQDCIRPDQVKELRKIAQKLQKSKGGKILIEGNTDARAPVWYNKKLAYKRAQSVYRELKHCLGDKKIGSVDVTYLDCNKEVKFDPRYDWWGKPNIPRTKKECTKFGLTKKECAKTLKKEEGGAS